MKGHKKKNMDERPSLNVNVIGNRTIYFCGDVTENSIARINTELIKMITMIINQAKLIKDFEPGHINLIIESAGGNVSDMWALIDLIIKSPIPIYTYALGNVYSAALIIFIAGSVRYVASHTKLMYHEASSSAIGKMSEINETTENGKKTQQIIDDFVVHRTKLKKKKLDEIKKTKTDYFFYKKEALELGVATNEFDMKDWAELIY